MRETSPWSPRLAESGGPSSERLITALAQDIVDGTMPPGARLPAHRALAASLGISIGTVTKAYAALERRGLVRGSPGRGMFVAYRARGADGGIDLATNAPPPMLGDDALTAAMTAVARRIDARGLADYGPPGGHLDHRQAVVSWIATTGLTLEPGELVLCNGAQQAIAAAMLAASPGGEPAPVFTEEFTFPGALRYAELTGHPVHAVGTDDEGIHPAALDRALAAHARASRARPLLYVTPVLHNPTTATMGSRRRREVVAVARRHDALIIEDDVYSLARQRTAPTLAELAPDRTYYVTSAAKALSPAVRVGALRPPAAHRDRAIAAVRALAQPVSPIQCELLAELTRAGIADQVRTAIRHEGARRSALARAILGPALRAADNGGYHAFLPLPRRLADAVVLAAASEGVELTDPASLMAAPGNRDGGLRVCLGRPSWAELTSGLATVRGVLSRCAAPSPM
ncbi:MAG: PLP-dependent aminotransferase family protein [Trebonia sp.]